MCIGSFTTLQPYCIHNYSAASLYGSLATFSQVPVYAPTYQLILEPSRNQRDLDVNYIHITLKAMFSQISKVLLIYSKYQTADIYANIHT